MKKVKAMSVLCAGMLVFMPIGGLADVYQWVDGKGQVHYGDRSPKGAAAKKIDMPTAEVNERQIPPSEISDAERWQRQKRVAETLSSERKSREEARQKIQDKKAEKQAKCDRLRIGLVESKSVNVYYRRDEEGKRVFISDKERKELEAGVEKKYQENCSQK